MFGKASTHAAGRGKPAPVSSRSNPAQVANSTQLQPPRPNGTPTDDEIRARAYSLWEQAGRPDGDGVEYWLQAEKELRNPR